MVDGTTNRLAGLAVARLAASDLLAKAYQQLDRRDIGHQRDPVTALDALAFVPYVKGLVSQVAVEGGAVNLRTRLGAVEVTAAHTPNLLGVADVAQVALTHRRVGRMVQECRKPVVQNRSAGIAKAIASAPLKQLLQVEPSTLRVAFLVVETATVPEVPSAQDGRGYQIATVASGHDDLRPVTESLNL